MTKLFILIPLLLVMSNCRKSDSSSCTAGRGGSVSVVVYASHNGVGLINYGSHPDTAFVKFNALTSPGTSPANYDTFYVSEAGENHIHCEGLKCGSHFIYRTAFDSVNNKRYTGTLPISFTEIGGEIDTTISVN